MNIAEYKNLPNMNDAKLIHEAVKDEFDSLKNSLHADPDDFRGDMANLIEGLELSKDVSDLYDFGDYLDFGYKVFEDMYDELAFEVANKQYIAFAYNAGDKVVEIDKYFSFNDEDKTNLVKRISYDGEEVLYSVKFIENDMDLGFNVGHTIDSSGIVKESINLNKTI